MEQSQKRVKVSSDSATALPIAATAAENEEGKSSGNADADAAGCIHVVHKLKCKNLKDLLPQFDRKIRNYRRMAMSHCRAGGEQMMEYNTILSPENDDVVIVDIIRKRDGNYESEVLERAGPRTETYFDPEKEVTAGIVTVGGLCPGLNNVIRELVKSLKNLYGVGKVYGFKGGYMGIWSAEPIELDMHNTAGIHLSGGTILSSARGGYDEEKILAVLDRLQINQLFVIGGDGTMRGANALSAAAMKRSKPLAIVSLPKTIDNDIDRIDRSFGFMTAVEEALRAVRSAKVEAQSCYPQGATIVRVMGRNAGFIAAHVTLVSGDVDLCLIPEVPIEISGERSILTHIQEVIRKNGHAVIVCAEGAGEELLGRSTEVDAGGNRKLPSIGYWLKEQVERSLHESGFPSAVVRYIDPSYMIRSVPPVASDALYTMLLAQNAVHGAMAGYTAITVGEVNGRVAYLPIDVVVAGSPRQLDPSGRTWERVLCATSQPPPLGKKQLTGSVTGKTAF